jgi:hypothetical protein
MNYPMALYVSYTIFVTFVPGYVATYLVKGIKGIKGKI